MPNLKKFRPKCSCFFYPPGPVFDPPEAEFLFMNGFQFVFAKLSKTKWVFLFEFSSQPNQTKNKEMSKKL
jgi:hypothetical protein